MLNNRAHKSLKWKTPTEIAFGETPDISNLIQFRWYDLLYYYEPTNEYPDSKEKLGRFIGIAPTSGDIMTYHIYNEETEKVYRRNITRYY